MMQSAKVRTLWGKDLSTVKDLVHHFWAWLTEWDQSKDTQVQRSDNEHNDPGGVSECDCFPRSDFMFAT